MGSTEGGLERPLPQVPEALSRERLRWEKELLGLYLSEHPLSSLAEQIAQFVTAYSGDLKDESLDGQRVVIGGMVTGVRTVTTRNKDTMAVATLEDLQGTLEVVVFPRMYATNGGTFAEGAILLVAGRIDHRGEEASVLADAAWVWEDAAARGPAVIAQEVAAGDRPRRTWPGKGGNGTGAPGGNGNGNGYGRPAVSGQNGGGAGATGPRPAAAVSATAAGSATAGSATHPPAPVTAAAPTGPRIRVSPLRGGGVTVLDASGSGAASGSAAAASGSAAVSGSAAAAASSPPIPISAAPTPDDFATFAPDREEPPLPEEAQAAAALASSAPTAPLEAPASSVLNVRFTRGAETARIVLAMEELRSVFKERPGATKVVFHIPGDKGATLPMEVRGGVAYDGELLSEVRRRLGEGLVRLEVSARR